MIFFEKNIFFYFLHFEYLSLYTYSIYIFFFCSYLYSFVNFLIFFSLHFFLKNCYTTKEMLFYYSNYNIILFFCYVKK
jgi:hypothetical protein